MLNVEQVKEKLKDRNITVIAQETGVSRQTIYNMVNGVSTPSLETLTALSSYFEEEVEYNPESFEGKMLKEFFKSMGVRMVKVDGTVSTEE